MDGGVSWPRLANVTGDVSVGGVLGPFPDVQEKRLATAVTAGETEVSGLAIRHLSIHPCLVLV